MVPSRFRLQAELKGSSRRCYFFCVKSLTVRNRKSKFKFGIRIFSRTKKFKFQKLSAETVNKLSFLKTVFDYDGQKH
jgi:hypothetical protein